MGLRFAKESNESHYIKTLQDAASSNSEKFNVYTADTMPKRYHFTENLRIAPAFVVPNLGYALAKNRAEGLTFVKGASGAFSKFVLQ